MTDHEIILVNEHDQVTGTGEKMEVHRKALMHRAFSVIILDSQGKMLLQRRALSKYHSAGLWTNACCSHPRPGEETPVAAQRRLQEELGFKCTLHYHGWFHYMAPFDNGLTENEIDHVFSGLYEGEVPFNPTEVEEVMWVDGLTLRSWMNDKPEDFTVWFRIIFERIEQFYPLKIRMDKEIG
ncbi:MAG: isopentenyl-diphosphate Delta-isomerase [Bacteroidales bacterium]